MPNAQYKRCRAQVLDLFTPEPIADSSTVERVAAELSGTPAIFPRVRGVDRTEGIWDLYLPTEAAEKHARGVCIDAGGWHCTIEFLGE
jgi:hypothetical protein